MQGGQIKHHIIAGPAPGDRRYDQHFGPERIKQPANRLADDMQEQQHVVHHAIQRKHRLEQYRIGHQRGDARQEYRCAQDRPATQARVVQGHRKQQGQHNHDRDLHDQKNQGVTKCAQEYRVLGQTGDVGEATERVVHAPAGLKAHPERPQDRINHEQAQQDKGGSNKTPAVPIGATYATTDGHVCSCLRSTLSPAGPKARQGVIGKASDYWICWVICASIAAIASSSDPPAIRPGICAAIAASASLVKMP